MLAATATHRRPGPPCQFGLAALHALHNLPFAKPQEADYIADEAWKQFRAHQHSTDPQEAARLLEEGENRLQIALHYGIAYPRLFHADQFEKVKACCVACFAAPAKQPALACCACTQVPYVQAPRLEEEPVEAVASGIKDRDVAAKLAAAARRRRERAGQQQRLEAQQQQQEGGPG